MNLLNFLQNYLSDILIAIGGFGAWFFERKKRKTEFQMAKASADHSVMDLYQEALDDLKKRYDEKFTELENDIKRLSTNLELWKTKYRKLKDEFDIYKDKHEGK